jgi:hypothetical protein
MNKVKQLKDDFGPPPPSRLGYMKAKVSRKRHIIELVRSDPQHTHTHTHTQNRISIYIVQAVRGTTVNINAQA